MEKIKEIVFKASSAILAAAVIGIISWIAMLSESNLEARTTTIVKKEIRSSHYQTRREINLLEQRLDRIENKQDKIIFLLKESGK